jgi:peptidoglycan/LPS O-acetylase OafA/YrhL
MEEGRSTIGWIGIAVGAVALLMAIVHFWMGPISPQPSVEKTVAEKAVAIKNATIAALKGEDVEEKAAPRSIDPDEALRTATSVLGGLALILGVVSFANKEPLRIGGGAAFLGGAAIAFQFAVIALGAIVLAILIGAVISQIGIE